MIITIQQEEFMTLIIKLQLSKSVSPIDGDLNIRDDSNNSQDSIFEFLNRELFDNLSKLPF
jgi:hypothetical protein